MNKALLPTVCFAALSTVAFEETVLATQNETHISENSTKTKIQYVNISNGFLNLRESASSSATVIATLQKGTEVTVISEANGWSKVKVNGKKGYVSSSYLTERKPGTVVNSVSPNQTVIKYVNISRGSLNMRKSASTGASIIIKLAKGKELKVLSESKGWAKVEAYGQTGYVSSQFLSLKKPSYNSSKMSNKITKYVNVNSDSRLNVRLSASTSAGVISKLTKGTKVIFIAEANGWAKININGKEGYVNSDFLSSYIPNADKKKDQFIETKYVNVSLGSTLNMRNAASVESSIIVKLPRGTKVTSYSEKDGWANVKAYGKMGYVSTQYLSVVKPSASSERDSNSPNDSPDQKQDKKEQIVLKYVNVMFGSTLNMRSDASTNSSILSKLSRGTVVTVYSEENNWARITANGKTGYVSSQYLSTSEPYHPIASNDSVVKTYQNFDISLQELTNIQMTVNPQTDKKYNTYIREDAIYLNGSTSGTVKGTSWNIRGGAGTDFWVVGTVKNGTTLPIISKIKGNDGYYWYLVDYKKSWVNASPNDVTYYLDPNNFLNTKSDSLQFLKLSVSANLQAEEVNEKILSGKGSIEGKASAFIKAGDTYKVNEIYLIAHALLETGNGTSQLAKGVQINGKTVYNMYGIGAHDGSALASGAEYAYNAEWFTPEDAIIGGAKFIAQGYINKGQDTLYKMRWNPNSSVVNGYASHQYASDIGWAAKQVKQIDNLYSLIDNYQLPLDIPKFK